MINNEYFSRVETPENFQLTSGQISGKMRKCEKSDATVNHDFIQFKYHVMVMKMEFFDGEDRYGTNCISIQTYSYDM